MMSVDVEAFSTYQHTNISCEADPDPAVFHALPSSLSWDQSPKWKGVCSRSAWQYSDSWMLTEKKKEEEKKERLDARIGFVGLLTHQAQQKGIEKERVEVGS